MKLREYRKHCKKYGIGICSKCVVIVCTKLCEDIKVEYENNLKRRRFSKLMESSLSGNLWSKFEEIQEEGGIINWRIKLPISRF